MVYDERTLYESRPAYQVYFKCIRRQNNFMWKFVSRILIIIINVNNEDRESLKIMAKPIHTKIGYHCFIIFTQANSHN